MDKPKLKHLGRAHYQGTYRGVTFEVFEQWHPSGLSQGWFIREGQNTPVRSGNTRGEAVRTHMLKVDGKISAAAAASSRGSSSRSRRSQ
jgi:hypothetical protein